MITQDLCDTLSKFLGISFKFPTRLKATTGIFSADNSSYVYYEADSAKYSFLLCYPETSFSFQTKNLDLKVIHQAMKDSTERSYTYAVKQSQLRSAIYKQLKKGL